MMDTSTTRKERALDMLGSIQTALTDDQLKEAIENLETLQAYLTEWMHTHHIESAKTWIDASVQEDLLAFKSDLANQHLQNWQEALDDPTDREFSNYQTRVQERIQKKQAILQVRGVLAHVQELMSEAERIEHGADAPEPAYMMSQFYQKISGIMSAAHSEFPNTVNLDVLFKKAQKLQENKALVAIIYPTAIEQNDYTTALSLLESVQTDYLIPRFIEKTTATSKQVEFSKMVSISEAKTELRTLAEEWAQSQAQDVMETASGHLASHHPQSAVDSFADRVSFDAFLTDELKEQLNALFKQAEAELDSLQRAEAQSLQAREMVAENPLQAWDVYAKAYHTYQWAEGLSATRETIVQALQKQLEELILQADHAFHARQMEHTQQIFQNAQRIYSQKDVLLDELLLQLEEMDHVSKQYEEYIENATTTLNNVQELLTQDTTAANDLLSQLESYPEIVLEAFPDLHQVRAQVNHQLNADRVYGELLNQMYVTDLVEVQKGIEFGTEASQEFEGDTRFPLLLQALQIHATFLQAQQHIADDKISQALELIQTVAVATNHPDQPHAQQLIEELQQSTSEE